MFEAKVSPDSTKEHRIWGVACTRYRNIIQRFAQATLLCDGYMLDSNTDNKSDPSFLSKTEATLKRNKSAESTQ